VKNKLLPAWRDAVRDSDLSTGQKAVLWTLGTYMNSKGQAYPSRETLAAGAGVCKRTVDAAVKAAENKKVDLLAVQRSGGRRPHRYQATLPPATVQPGAPLAGGKEPNPQAATVQPAAPNGATPSTSTVQPGTPESGVRKRKERKRSAFTFANAPVKAGAPSGAPSVYDTPTKPVDEGNSDDDDEWWLPDLLPDL
jgi:hypothetical protein